MQAGIVESVANDMISKPLQNLHFTYGPFSLLRRAAGKRGTRAQSSACKGVYLHLGLLPRATVHVLAVDALCDLGHLGNLVAVTPQP
jgi:hypothetical protein